MANYKPKQCKKCGAEFTPAAPRSTYCTPECSKAKNRERMRKYRATNKDSAREYYAANRERLNANRRKYYQDNKERLTEYDAAYRQAN